MSRFPKFLIGLAVTALSVGARAESDAAETSTAGIEDIIVTAQKRAENAQKVPLAVTSLSGYALDAAHVTGATDLSRVVPDVRVSLGGAAGDPGGTLSVFSIRGLGASATGPQGSAGVAVHVDGVYADQGITNGEFYDLERVEVDPGPQGTLYGRSAAAGAVNVIPNKPTGAFAGDIKLEGGNYGAFRAEGMVNVPVADDLALRGAFQTLRHDGYLSNGYDDQDSKSVRLQALYTPTAELSARLYVDYIDISDRGASDIFVGGANLPFIASVAPPQNSANIRDRSIANYCAIAGQVRSDCYQSTHLDRVTTHLNLSYDLGWGIVEAIPAFSRSHREASNANAPLPLSTYDQVPFDDEQTTFELRLSDAGKSAVKWVAGFNIYHNDVDDNVVQNINPLAGFLPVFGNGPGHPPTGFAPGLVSIQAFNDQNSSQDSYAVFGQATYPVLPWLRITGGARYNIDQSDYNGVLGTSSQILYYLNGGRFPITSADILSPISTGALNTSATFHAFTYRFAIDADLTPTVLAYASVGSGYKPGGLNDGGAPSTNSPQSLAIVAAQYQPPLSAAQIGALAPANSFDPEKVTHYELGIKSRFWDNRIQINDAVYYDDYSNYQNGQTEVVNPLIYRVQGFVVSNAGAARVYGNELSVKWHVTPDDDFGASLNYLRATFSSYVAPAYLTPSTVAPANDLRGKTLPNAPQWSATVSYRHIFQFADQSQIAVNLFSSLSSAYWTDYAQSAGTRQSGYTRTTIDVSWISPDALWEVDAFVNNLEDADVKSFGLASAGYSQVHVDPPRLFGASISRHF